MDLYSWCLVTDMGRIWAGILAEKRAKANNLRLQGTGIYVYIFVFFLFWGYNDINVGTFGVIKNKELYQLLAKLLIFNNGLWYDAD